MKSVLLTWLVMMVTALSSRAENGSPSLDMTGTYTGRVTSVVMNGKAVSKSRFEGKTFRFSLLRDKENYVLTGHLNFDGGPAHHVISLPAGRAFIALSPDGQIVRGYGKGHISVKVFHLFSALNKDFNIKSLKGSLEGNQLSFTMHVLIPDYKKGYTASFSFIGNKIK